MSSSPHFPYGPDALVVDSGVWLSPEYIAHQAATYEMPLSAESAWLDAEEDEDEAVASAEIVNALYEAIHKHLTPKQSFVLRCRYRFAMTRDEIAQLMGITQQGVSRIEGEGVAALRRHLVPEMFPADEAAPRCAVCDTPMPGARSNRRTCSDACRTRLRRERRVTVSG